jgi:hypothetical protein
VYVWKEYLVTRIVKLIPNWSLILLLIFFFFYSPVELTRVIYVTTWGNIYLTGDGIPKWEFIGELVVMWINIILGIGLLYFRLKRTA